MELRQLNIFRILAHELSFTRAARRANCVQSNVTVQIRSMEDELGVPLFERLGRQVRLTSHGVRLLPYAEKVLHLMDEASSVAIGREEPNGTLTIGAPESVLTYRLPRVVQIFRKRYPEVELIFRSSGTSELPAQLEQGLLDFGLVIDDGIFDAHLQTESLCPEKLMLVASPHHALSNRSAVRPADLSKQTLLLTDPGCAYRSKLERALARGNSELTTVMEFSSVETIKQCAMLGMGIACLPAIVVKKEIAEQSLTSLAWKGGTLTMRTLMAWRKKKWMSPAMSAFIEILREQITPSP